MVSIARLIEKAAARSQIGGIINQLLEREFRQTIEIEQQFFIANFRDRSQHLTYAFSPYRHVQLHAAVLQWDAVFINGGN